MLQSSPANLSAAEHARLNSWMIDIAGEACGTPIGMGGQWRFGSNRSGLCVFDNGQFHDYSGGAHGFSTFELIEHLYPGDPVEWARAWLDEHPGNGSFVPGESEPDADFAEVEATAYINSLYNGAARIDDTPGYIYLTATESRGLPLRPEDAAQLRWIANYRGEEGALLVPVTDDEGELVKLLVIIVTPDGSKSSWFSRSTIRGAKRPGLVRFGTPGPNVVETEGVEKGLAARAAGSPYVVVTSGASNLGKVALPTVVRRVVIARDADPAGSPAGTGPRVFSPQHRRMRRGMRKSRVSVVPTGCWARSGASSRLRQPTLAKCLRRISSAS